MMQKHLCLEMLNACNKTLTRRPAKRTKQMKATEETTTTAIAFPESASGTRRTLCIWKE